MFLQKKFWAYIIYFHVCLVSIFLLSTPACANERIKYFKVYLTVFPDGHVDIEEEIHVSVQNSVIKHGIYRDIPTEYLDQMGNRVGIRFSLNSMKRNGIPEPYHIRSMSNGLRIYIGDKDTIVAKGEQTYSIKYSVSRVIGFFETYDELYWNITGNGWEFPIDHAKVEINFPNEAIVQNYAGYTGSQGEKYKNYQARVRENYFMAETTKSLNPHEGFTVAVSIPKSIIQPETEFQKKIAFLRDNIAWAAYLILSLGLFFFFLISWWYYGRDVPGVIFPRFQLLKGLRPDFLRYVYQQDYDTGVFTTLLIDAAVRGYIQITENQSSIEISWKNDFNAETSKDPTVLILRSLLMERGKFSLPKKFFFSHDIFSKDKRIEIANNLSGVRADHSHYLSIFGINYFNKNWPIRIIGGCILALSLFSAYTLSLSDDQKTLILITTLLTQTGIFLIFYKPLSKYTDIGQRLKDYADGLKLFLTVSEEARLNKLYPKTVTPQKFEEFLPYAFALGVEQEWCQHFSKLIESGQTTYNEDKSPSWYRGVNNKSLTLSALSTSLSSSLQSTISSASTPPTSTSGSLGSGSSGGGGGGGGGGGW